MRILWIGGIMCLIFLSCSYGFDNPFDSKSTVEPTAPTGLKAVALNDSTIELTWEDSQGEMGYKIERGIDGEPLHEIGSISQNGTHFVDEGLLIGRRYSYRVTAFAANGKEAYINITGKVTMTLPGGATMEMVWVEPGTFMMGSPEDEPGRFDNEGPQHEVTITRGFYLGKCELTQGQWESVMGTRPWAGSDLPGKSKVRDNPNYPAVYITWNDMQAFILKLNQTEGVLVYRLPTEAEWEYACRAGTTTQWSFGDDEGQLWGYAWYSSNTRDVGEEYAHEVGTKLPNPWGLYDMHGNATEWVQDRQIDKFYGVFSSDSQTDPTGPTGAYRVFRGGPFIYAGRFHRSAYRRSSSPYYCNYTYGARLVRQGP